MNPSFIDPPLGRSVTSREVAQKVRELDRSDRLNNPINLSAWLPDRPYWSAPNYLREMEAYYRALDEVQKDLEQYATILIVGGSGPIIALGNNHRVHDLILSFYRTGKPVAAICYGVTCLTFARDLYASREEMELLLMPKKQAPIDRPEPLSAASLIERGIVYFQQERYTEGITLLTMACEHLLPDHRMHFAALLDVLTQEYAKYSHLEQTLQEVSVRFAEVHAELQASRAALSDLGAALLIDSNSEHIFHIPGHTQSPSKQASVEDGVVNPGLYAICLGPFEVRCLGVPISLCSNRNGQAILRYLVAQLNHSATADILMALFWPEDPAEVALRKLQVTISILRRSLQTGHDLQGGYILYKQHVYQLNPSVPLHSDVEEFLVLYNAGCKTGGDAAASYYERACSLYKRPFLIEDLYADWSFTRREQLRHIHLDMCSALASHYLETRSYEKASRWAAAIIEENHCDEAAYRQLMRIYALQGRRNDALREYQRCQRVLLDELGMQPMPETVALYHAITRGELNQ
jgi:DNA-binding SARP family transcriptional activator